MLRDLYRQKLLNAILFFAKRVKYPSRVKLFKLLFFLDFAHIRERGTSVTNQDYSAWDFGPVPARLFEEIKRDLPADFQPHLRVSKVIGQNENEMYEYTPLHDFDQAFFSPRELRIMQELVEIWKDEKPSIMSEATHFPKTPWDKTRKEKGLNSPIDPVLALDDSSSITEEDVRTLARERAELLSNHS